MNEHYTNALELDNPRVLNGWAMFDWANGAFALVITVAVFPDYFNAMTNDTINVLGMSIPNTALFAYLVSGSYLLIALVSPCVPPSAIIPQPLQRPKFD